MADTTDSVMMAPATISVLTEGDDAPGAEVKVEAEKSEGKMESEEDMYAYLERDEFSSENFKIEIKGLPHHYGFKDLKKMLTNKLKLNPHKIKPAGKGKAMGYVFVCFRTELEKQKALESINGYTWKNRTLTAELAKAVADPLIKKRTHEETNKGSVGFFKDESIEDAMKRVTTPWSTVPYDEQLKRKMASTDIIACEMTKKILETNRKLDVKLVSSKICPIETIIPSPVTEGYRNKCEFTVGYHPVTNEKMVGFRASSYKQGSTGVGPIVGLVHMPQNMIKTALGFETFIRSSPYGPFNPETHEGVWKGLTVRTSDSGEVMVIVIICAKELTGKGVDDIKKELIEKFSGFDDPKINSFYFKISEAYGQQDKNIPELLFGQEYITEIFTNGLKFRISPEAFFQVNVKGAEVLYSTLGKLLQSNPNTTLLDVCSGTGTIGISLANSVGQVLGVEMVNSAVMDARKNAEINNLGDKCEFFAGRAENIMDGVLDRAKPDHDIVAICDPPRAGLHQRVLQQLRKCEKIKHLIYVSCDVRLALKNFVDLARPASKNYKGAPFIPKRIIPVDLFPHTHHLETILVFERQT